MADSINLNYAFISLKMNAHQKILSDIDKYGWHIINVLEDNIGPGFSYTIGLYKTYGHPEVVIFGLPLNIRQTILSLIGENVKKGDTYVENKKVKNILENHDVVFRKVNNKNYDEYFGQALWYYEKKFFPVLQCIWPDKSGLFPFEKGFSEKIMDMQPII